ncbi:MAG: hypothetical protein JW996_03580, partial [Candidatus Cloacimonetes bacterium]|nr:hypothetical protein [Candidatus Cloacimonadota bacterium]
WYLLLSYICYQLLDIFKFKKTAYGIVYGLVLLQVAINTGFYLKRGLSAKPGFSSFVAEEQFKEIRRELDLESDIRIGCIGFFPAVANYNGFMTIGSFSAYYPLSYKNKFRRIISHELDKNPELKDYFDKRGSALLLFDDEIGRYYQDQDYLRKNIPSINSELDFGLIRSLNVEYIFSTCEIINDESAGLKMVYLSNNVDHYYRIYVYKLS